MAGVGVLGFSGGEVLGSVFWRCWVRGEVLKVLGCGLFWVWCGCWVRVCGGWLGGDEDEVG